MFKAIRLTFKVNKLIKQLGVHPSDIPSATRRHVHKMVIKGMLTPEQGAVVVTAGLPSLMFFSKTNSYKVLPDWADQGKLGNVLEVIQYVWKDLGTNEKSPVWRAMEMIERAEKEYSSK